MKAQPEKRRLLLINPVSQFRKGFAQDLTSKHPPLCLAIIAAHTPENWKIRIVDENFQRFRFREADLVGITSFTPSAPRAYEIAGIFREQGIKVVMGGIHASMCPEEALQYVDSVVTGEAETVWGQVVQDFEAGSMQQIYQGTLADQRNLPKPRHDLLDPRYVFHSIQTSRGCPMNCDFCSVTAFNGNHYRLRPVDEVLEEMELFRNSGRALFIVDDNIVGSGKRFRERAKELFRGMIERDLKMNWFSQASINMADDEELLSLAARSGCRLLLVGIEAETDEALRSANKSLNLSRGVESYRQVFKKINKHGIAVLGTFVFGLESDRLSDLVHRTNYILRSGVDAVQASMLTPLPGTTLMHRMKIEDRITVGDFPEGWKHFHFVDLVFRHPNIESRAFIRAMSLSWKRIYHPLRILRLFIGTWMATRRLTPALWAFDTNRHYRHIVFEKDQKENQEKKSKDGNI